MDETRTARLATARAVAPLIVVNALAVYGQLAYAMANIAPAGWPTPFRVALSIGFAAAVESVALYVGWHAHDALLLKSHATARNLRRWSFLIAAVVAGMNYAHFAAPGLRPTAAAVAFGLLSLLSPWMWGLHTRRAARLQLLKERRVDEGGAEFSPERRRAFPIRTWQARRWSIDHGVTDPREAWEGYNAERAARRAAPAPAPIVAEVVPVPSVPRQRRALAAVPTSGGPAIGYDLDKLVRLLLEDADADALMATGASAKSVQRVRRVLAGVAAGDADAILARGGTSTTFVAKVRDAYIRAMADAR